MLAFIENNLMYFVDHKIVVLALVSRKNKFSKCNLF